jgi:hypothetical protein
VFFRPKYEHHKNAKTDTSFEGQDSSAEGRQYLRKFSPLSCRGTVRKKFQLLSTHISIIYIAVLKRLEGTARNRLGMSFLKKEEEKNQRYSGKTL